MGQEVLLQAELVSGMTGSHGHCLLEVKASWPWGKAKLCYALCSSPSIVLPYKSCWFPALFSIHLWSPNLMAGIRCTPDVSTALLSSLCCSLQPQLWIYLFLLIVPSVAASCIWSSVISVQTYIITCSSHEMTLVLIGANTLHSCNIICFEINLVWY
jgi:hypothetical protein